MAQRKSSEDADRIAKAYWEWHVAAKQGLKPVTEFVALRSVADAVLRSGATPEEVEAAMKATRVMTAQNVLDAIVSTRDGTATADTRIAKRVARFAIVATGTTWRQTEEELSGLARVLRMWGWEETAILAAMCLSIANIPYEPIDPTKAAGMLPRSERVAAAGCEPDEIERRALAWRAMVP